MSNLHHASKPQVSFRDCYIGQAAFRVIHQKNTIVLKIVDNTLPGAYFYVGSRDEKGKNIKLLDDQTGQTEPLKRVKNKHFTLRLPDGLDITRFDQFGIWSTGINRSLSHVDIKQPETDVIDQQKRPIGPNQKCKSRRRRSLRTPANNADMPNFEHFPKKSGFGKDSIDKPIEPISADIEEPSQQTSQKPWVDLKKRQDLSVETQTLPTDNVIDRIDNDEDYNDDDDNDDDDDTNPDNDVECYEQSSSTTERQMVSMELLKNSKSSSPKAAPLLSESVVIQPSPPAPNPHALADKSIYNMEPFEEIKPANEQAPAWQKYWQLNHMVANYSSTDKRQLKQTNHVPSKEEPKLDEHSINLLEKSKLISQLKERLKNRKIDMASLVSSNQSPFSKSKTRKPSVPAHFQDPMTKAEKFFAVKNKLIAERRNRPFGLEKSDRYKASEKSSDFRSYLSDLLSPLKRLLKSALGYPSDPPSRRSPQVKRKLFLPWEQTRLPSPTRRSHRRRKPHLTATMTRSQMKHIYPGNVPKPMPTPAYVGKNMLQSQMLAIHHQTKRKTQENFMEEHLRKRNRNPFLSQNNIGQIDPTLSPKSKPKKETVTNTTATTTKATSPPTPPLSGLVERGSNPVSPSSSSLDEFRPILPLVNGGALPALAFNVLDSSLEG
ncbi:hypothetical protein TCAL_10453 [Tigriopus californicus]|uniref:DM13 domain-containing protein n=2 Tax=Tigriopus californicus TaxID=6832 RepID=A0A553PGK0_TIGCA|nr:hypothetical protein TCAL_10453 [Tigriopus californicus]